MQARSASLPEPDGGGASARGGQAQLLSLGFNYLSAVSLVVLNKMVFVGMAFSWPAAMTLFHYAVTLVLLWTLRLAGVFESVKVPMSSRMYLLAVIVGLTPVVNLMALRFSSVGMFQTSKLCLVPLVVLVERLTQGKAVSLARGTALSVVVAATAASIVDDLELTALGLFWCLVWIPFAALYNIMTAQEMAASGVGPLQLLYRLLPYSMVVMTSSLALDPPGVLSYDFTPSNVTALVLTGVGAFCVNWSGVWVLGCCSPLTLTIMGPLKSSSILLVSYLLDVYSPTPTCLLYAMVSIGAVAAYTHINMREKSAAAGAVPVAQGGSKGSGGHTMVAACTGGSGDDGTPLGAADCQRSVPAVDALLVSGVRDTSSVAVVHSVQAAVASSGGAHERV